MIKRLKRKIQMFEAIIFLLLLGIVFETIYLTILNNNYQILSAEYSELQSESESIQTELSDRIRELEEKLPVIVEPNNVPKSKPVAADVLKYDYVYKTSSGEKTDLTKSLVKYGYNLMEEKGMDPSLLFGIIMVESEGNASSINSESGAAGLGQFVESTGDFVYTKLMNNEEYDHNSTPYDAKTNITMIVTYLDYLYDKYNGSTMDVLKEYCGGDDLFTYNYYLRVSNYAGYCIN